MGRHFITQPQAGHLYRFINRELIKPSKKVSVNPCPHKWLLRQRGQIEGFCQGNFSPRRFTSLRFTSTNSIIELLWLGLLCPTCFGQLGSAKIQLPFFHKKTASGQRSFNSIILTDLSNHSENAGGVLLIINRKLTTDHGILLQTHTLYLVDHLEHNLLMETPLLLLSILSLMIL